MQAIVSYSITTYGCQMDNGRMINWTGGGATESQIVQFTHNPKISNEVNAMKNMKMPSSFGNTFATISHISVEIIPSV